MTVKLGPLQCITNAPEEYDYGWQRTLVRNIATDDRGRSWRLCENADQWHLDQQVVRYSSGLHQGLTDQAQVDSWFGGERPILTLTDNPVPIIRLAVNMRNYLDESSQRRREILEAVDVKIDGVTFHHEELLYVFTCEGEEAAQSLRATLEAAGLEVETHGPQPPALDTAE